MELPVLHPADPFLETAGEDIRRRMFVTEGRRGERLALRPDFTIPVCLQHLESGAGAQRYAYEGLVFRRHDAGSPERLETGYEDIGRAARIEADAEALALAAAGVGTMVEGPLTVRLGDIGLLVGLLKALGLPGRWRRRLRRSFGLPAVMARNLDRLAAPRGDANVRLDGELRAVADREDRDGMVALLSERALAHGHGDGLGRSPAEIADRFFDQRALPDAALAARAAATLRLFLELQAELGDATGALERFEEEHRVGFGEALPRFSERARAIAAQAPCARIRFEAGFGRPLDYYTGVVFEVRSASLPFPVAGGGRYDRLMEMLGATDTVPAVGFTMRLDFAASESGS